MTNTEAVVPASEPRQITLPTTLTINVGKIVKVLALIAVTVAVTAGAFLFFSPPANPLLDGHNTFKAPGGILTVDPVTGSPIFTPTENPSWTATGGIYPTSPGMIKCLTEKGYPSINSQNGLVGRYFIVPSTDYNACVGVSA